jgi:DNA repair protein RadC
MEQKTNDSFALETVSIRLVRETPLFSNEALDNPIKVADALWEHLKDFDREVMCVVNFDSQMRPINVNFASMGAISQTVAHPRELFKSSILSNASSMMLVHNHPSGITKPSLTDRRTTADMSKLCAMMDIPLIDHIIIGINKDDYFSFAENELLPSKPKEALSFGQRLDAVSERAR